MSSPTAGSQPNQVKRKPWKSLGSDKEIKAEAALQPDDKDTRMILHFSAPRELFVRRRTQLPHNAGFNPKDAMEDPKDLRSTRLESEQFALVRAENDMGTQAGVPQLCETGVQTPMYRKINMCIQATPSIVDARLQPGKEDEKMPYAMKTFIDRVMPRMIHNLTLNNEVPIFVDDYARLTDEDNAPSAAREDNGLREAGNFSHMYTKQKYITSIDWRSGSRASVICLSCINANSLEERLEQQNRVECSVCLVWDFVDHMHPLYILEAPNEILVVKFHPKRANIIIGGMTNGQIVAWDTTRSQDTSKKQTGKHRMQQQREEDVTVIPPMPEPIKGLAVEKDGDATVSRLQPIQITSVRSSHKRAVHDLCWFPDDLELAFDGKMIQSADNSQFASLSEDGTMLFWDLDPDKLPLDKKRRRKQQGTDSSKEWIPLMKFVLSRPDGTGDILGLRFAFFFGPKKKEGEKDSSKMIWAGPPAYTVCVTSMEGEFAVCNFAPKDDKAQTQTGFTEEQGKKEGKLIKSISMAHTSAGWAVHRHPDPEINDIYMTVGDWCFKIWKIGLDTPILTSPSGDVPSPILCGRWSPTRAGVIFVGTKDGIVQIWDLLDRSHEPVMKHPIGSDAITVLEFKPTSTSRAKNVTHILAVGTKVGSFHLFELPKAYSKSQVDETAKVKHMFEREVRRVSYFQWRWKERQRELDRTVQEKADQMNAERAGDKRARPQENDEAPVEDAEYLGDPTADQEFEQEVMNSEKEIEREFQEDA